LRREELKEMEKEFSYRRMEENEKDEQSKLWCEEVLRKQAQKREADREKKRESARRYKAALKQSGEATLRKGKWPHCMK
jgi:hypothetical protein